MQHIYMSFESTFLSQLNYEYFDLLNQEAILVLADICAPSFQSI